jgi:hypothetical protein
MDSKSKGRVRWIEFFSVLLVGIGMTILVTWPFARKIGVYYQDAGDYPLNGWILWYDQMAIKTGRIFHQKKYFNTTQMYPLPDTLCYSENMFFPSLLFSPIYWITHDLIFSVNFFALLTFVLSFLSAYYCINYFVKDWRASLIGAAIYAFNPITLASFPFHIQLMNKYFLPLLFLFGYRYFKEPNWKDGFYFWFFFVLNGLSVIYFEVFTVVLLPFFLLPFLIQRVLRKDWVYFWKIVKYGGAGLLLLPFLFYFYLPYLQFSRKEGTLRGLNLDRHYSARLIDWFCSSIHNLFYGHIAWNIIRIRASVGYLFTHHVLFLNIVPFILCLLGLYSLFIRKLTGDSAIDPLLKKSLLIFLITSAMFSMGPFFLGWKSGFGSIKLPFYYFYVLTPVFNGIRTPSRFQYLFYVPFSIFSTFGTGFIFKKLENRSFFFSGLLMVILASIVIENYNVKSFRQKSYILDYLSGKKKFSFLKNQTTFHYPTFVPLIQNSKFILEAIYLNWDTATGETMMNGYSGYFPTDWVRLLSQFKRNLGRKSLKELEILGVQYVIIHKNLLSPYSFQKLWLKHGKLYEQALVYHGQNTLILKLKRYHFAYRLCHFPQDFLKEGIHVYGMNGQPSYYQMLLKNERDCYLPSPFNKRYLPLNFTIGGEKYHSYLKFPLLIDPYQTVSLRGYFHPIKNDSAAITKFTTSLQLSPSTQ